MEIEHMRSEIAKQVNESLNDFLDTSIDDIGFKEEFYVGKVINNNDPDKIGRCRIRVFGVFEADVPDNELPWAMPDFSFIGSKIGSFIVPPIDTIVRVYFDKGNINLPHYTVKVVDKNNLPSERNIDYPNNMIMFKTDEGDFLSMNRKSKKLTFIHNSGTKLEIDASGNADVLVVGNSDTDIKKNSTETAVENMTKEVTGTGKITIEHKIGMSKIEIDSMGNINITQGPVGSINIGGQKAQMFCPDLQVCPITGSPLSILTKVPGFMVKVS
jgi:hypothetical protein